MVKQERKSKHVLRASESDALEQLLTIADVMGLLKVSRPKVYDLLNEGLPTIKFGRAVRFQPATLRRWLANRERVG